MNRGNWMAWCLGCTLAGSIGGPASATPPTDKPAGPQSIPGDTLPPFNMLDASGHLIPPPAALAGGLHKPDGVESTARGPNLDLSIGAARAAIDNCTARGYQGAATVIDSAGQARAMLSADGSDGSHVFVAQRKALTALEFKMPSSEVREAISHDGTLMVRVKPYMFVQFGAFPIVAGGVVIGAIGYSGGDDVVCAKAGLDWIESKLNK